MFSAVILIMKVAPATRSLSLTRGALSTTSGGAGAAPTVTATPLEQLFPVSDSPDTESTQAP